MLCHDVQRKLDDYSCDLLPAREFEQVEAHLATCQTCTREAAVMKNLTDKLSNGLHEWVNQGECPPEISLRIANAVRAEAQASVVTIQSEPTPLKAVRPQRSFWKGWPTRLGAIAAAAAVAAFAFTRPDVSAQLAALPLVGGLAAQFMDYDLEYTTSSGGTVAAALLQPGTTIKVGRSVEHMGVTLTVDKVKRGQDATTVTYSMSGLRIDNGANPELYRPVLSGKNGDVPLRSFRGIQQQDKVNFTARFDALPNDQFSFRLPSLPMGGTAEVVWQQLDDHSFQRIANSTDRDVKLVSWVQQDGGSVVTVSWPDAPGTDSQYKLVRFNQWQAIDADGAAHPVKLEGAPVQVDGKWIQQVRIQAPTDAHVDKLVATSMELLVPGAWEINQ